MLMRAASQPHVPPAPAPKAEKKPAPAPQAEKDEDKVPAAFKTISEAAALLNLPQHVLRFWESRFPQIKPVKRGGGRRYYRPQDIDTLAAIKRLLYKEGYTIKGARKAIAAHAHGQSAPTKKPEAAPVEDTPLFQPCPEPAAAQDKAELHAIYKELLELRAMLRAA